MNTVEISEEIVEVTSQDTEVTVEVTEQIVEVEIATQGMPGQKGDSGNDGIDGADGADGKFIDSFIGDWDNTVGYYPGDMVYADGSTWMLLESAPVVPAVNIYPPLNESPWWRLVARKGQDGSGGGGDADTLDGHDSTYFINTGSDAQTKSGNLTIDGVVAADIVDLNEVQINAGVLTVTNTSWHTLDVFDVNEYRSVEYVLQFSQASSFTTTRVILLQDSANAAMTEYATVSLGSPISYDLDVDFVSTNLEFKVLCTDVGSDPVDIICKRILFDR